MRLVLHRKVRTDVDIIMEHYGRVASRELAAAFTPSYGVSCSTPQSGLSRSRFASATFAASTSIASLTIFSFVLLVTKYEFSLFDTIGGILYLACIDGEPSLIISWTRELLRHVSLRDIANPVPDVSGRNRRVLWAGSLIALIRIKSN